MNLPLPNAPHMPMRRDPLLTTACICVILATIGLAVDVVRQRLAMTAASMNPTHEVGKLEERAFTNAHAAHFTFTNLNAFPTETCVRGIVALRGGSGRAVTAPVCTGEMKPRTTVLLEASYGVGEVEQLCAGDRDRWGNFPLDWSKCTFTIEEIAR